MTTIHNLYQEKMQDGDVYIGRPGRGQDGYFGNPIVVGRVCLVCQQTHTTGGDTLPCYRRWLWQKLKTDSVYKSRVKGLIDSRLFCFCKPKPCHGDILIKAIEWLNQDSTDSFQLVKGNIWDYLNKADILCVTTNGVVKPNGELVMGAGVALQASRRFPSLPKVLGRAVKEHGNHVHTGVQSGKTIIVSFPTKHNWKDKSDLILIEQSITELIQLADAISAKQIVLTPPGCGNGGLCWNDVEPLLKRLNSRFIVVNN